MRCLKNNISTYGSWGVSSWDFIYGPLESFILPHIGILSQYFLIVISQPHGHRKKSSESSQDPSLIIGTVQVKNFWSILNALSLSGVTTHWCTMMAYLSDCNRKIRWPSGLEELATPQVLYQGSVGRAIFMRRHSSLHEDKSNSILWDCRYGLSCTEFFSMGVYIFTAALCCWESVGENCRRQSRRFVIIIKSVIDNFTDEEKSEKEYHPCSNLLGSNLSSILFRKQIVRSSG